ncbi:MAG: ATP-dependent DNA ligase [Candidatus Aenigmarchaeota archaeon]|nr:ATP-dependent DNA ligase [Candidatus Aenigmarchaeota archaeon]
MKYLELVEIYEKLEATTKKLEKRDILADFYKKCGKDLYKAVLLSMGTVVTGEQDLGVAREMLKRIVIKSYGVSEGDFAKKFKETGDLGLSAEHFSRNKKQKSFMKKELTLDHVFDNIHKLTEVIGKGSQERKVDLIVELLSHSSPEEARYIVRTVTGDMRIGVSFGIVRDAIAKGFDKDPKEVESSWNVSGNFGKVAEMAREGKLKSDLEVFTPVRVMLADRAGDLREALETFEKPFIQTKYDGLRLQLHRDGTKVKLFSRRLDDITNQFPEIVKWANECIKAKSCIIEAEVIAIDENGRPRPFQFLSRRVQRKYDIDRISKEIPVQANFFDLLFVNGDSWIDKPFRERWEKLIKIIDVKKGKFILADSLETKDYKEAEKFYRAALAFGEEGVIVKNSEAKYQSGRRVGYWLKVKEILEPLDLVVVGGTWGEGKRAKWIGSLLLAAKSGDEYVETGRMASGLTEDQMEELTKKLKSFIVLEQGNEIKIKPKLVIEVGYEEIQKSPTYPSGYALRFPKLLRIRDEKDKGPNDINNVKDIEKLFFKQRGKVRKN